MVLVSNFFKSPSLKIRHGERERAEGWTASAAVTLLRLDPLQIQEALMKSVKKHTNPSCSATLRLRAPGQLTIQSTRLFRTPNSNPNPSDSTSQGSIARPFSSNYLSFSDYLNRRLHRTTSVLPAATDSTRSSSPDPLPKDNRNPFSISSRRFGDDTVCAGSGNQSKRSEIPAEAAASVITDSVFKQFNYTCTKPEDEAAVDFRKRKNRPGGLVIIGDDPKPKRRTCTRPRTEDYSVSEKKRGFRYNHYENGTGWWDCEREGIDNDEVGCNEVWEGMTSTTLGGLPWH